MSPESWSTYWVGVVVGLMSGLILAYVTWRLPSRMNNAPKRMRKRELEEQELRQWHEQLLNTPMRSLDDIQADREPVWEQPVVAAGMQPEPPAPREPFKGPPVWRLRDWWTWSYGDVWRRWSRNGAEEQDRQSQRVVRTL